MSGRRRVIVLGAAGQLGRRLVDRLGADADREVIGFDKTALDVCDAGRVREVLSAQRPEWLVNAAAMTQVDLCESQTDRANAINAHAVGRLADLCNRTQTTLVHIGTDFVFDGRSRRPYREDDPTNPINAYGRSKLIGEENACTAHRHMIVRSAWLYGPGGRNFVETILDKAAAGTPLRVVDDQTGSPTCTVDLADGIARLMRVRATGVYHVVNDGEATWYELAREAVALAGLETAVEPIATAAYPTPAQRPAYSVLDCERYRRATGHRLSHWTAALAAFVRRRTEDKGRSDFSG